MPGWLIIVTALSLYIACGVIVYIKPEKWLVIYILIAITGFTVILIFRFSYFEVVNIDLPAAKAEFKTFRQDLEEIRNLKNSLEAEKEKLLILNDDVEKEKKKLEHIQVTVAEIAYMQQISKGYFGKNPLGERIVDKINELLKLAIADKSLRAKKVAELRSLKKELKKNKPK